MASIKEETFIKVRDRLPIYKNKTDHELDVIFFQTERSLKLTLLGFQVLSGILKPYRFELPVEMKSKYTMALSQLSSPFYRTTKSLIILISGGCSS